MEKVYLAFYLIIFTSIIGWQNVHGDFEVEENFDLDQDFDSVEADYSLKDYLDDFQTSEANRSRRSVIRRVLRKKIPTTPRPPKKEICLTKGCVKAANSILESINFNADPCEDFYEYSCGNWIKSHVIPTNLNSYNNFAIAQEQLQVALKNVLEENINPTFKPYILVRDAYKACINEGAIETLGTQPLIEILNEILGGGGGWPVLLENRWTDYNFNWLTSLAALSKYNLHPMITCTIIPDPKNNGKHIINLDKMAPLMAKDFYINDDYESQRIAYMDYMKSILRLLNNGRLTYYQEYQLRDILDFEIKIVKLTIAPDKVKDENKKYNKLTVADLQRKYSYWIDFKTFFSNISPENLTIEYTDMVKVTDLDYFQNLGYLIQRSPKRVVANYLGWQFISSVITHMAKGYSKIRQNFMQVISPISTKPERWRFCIDYVNNFLPEAVGKLYVDKNFPIELRRKVLSLITNIRKTFREIIVKTDWMDIKTKKFALEKLRAVTPKVGFPTLFTLPAKMEQKYVGLKIYPERHFTNIVNIWKFLRNQELNLLRKPVNKLKWYTKTADINPIYTPLDNSLIFPAPIIKAPFYDIDRPRVMDYGSLGTIIGQTLLHGFDDQGRHFDKNGNLFEWWSVNSEKKFTAKTQCFVDQYKEYLVPEVNLKINGKNTQVENIADNMGLKKSYLAYKKYQRENGEGIFLPGVNVTQDQLFFLSFGQTWCGMSRVEALKNDVLSNSHSPSKYRVNGVVKNSKGFSKAFNCPSNSKMYSDKPCEIW